MDGSKAAYLKTDFRPVQRSYRCFGQSTGDCARRQTVQYFYGVIIVALLDTQKKNEKF